MRRLLAFAAVLAASHPAFAQPPPGPWVSLGVEVPSLADLARLGPELRAAGANTVVASGPLGAAMIPWLWSAGEQGMTVLLRGEPASASPSGTDDRDGLMRAYDYGYWTRQGPGRVAFVFMPRLSTGLTLERYSAAVLAAKAGNPSAQCAAGEWLSELRLPAELVPGADLLAIYLTPDDIQSIPPQVLAQQIIARDHELQLEDRRQPIFVAFVGDGPQAAALTEPALEAAASAALEASGVVGVLFLQPASEAIRKVQLAVVAKLAAHLGDRARTIATTPSARQQALASESSSPLLWRLKRYGEVTTSGLTPYVTPDGSAGYNVGGRALLDLAIPNRSAWVDARKLTRFSMRMFSTVEGQGALLALSTGGEVSFVRVPIVTGWHLYQMDLIKAAWESQKPGGEKWGGTTGVVQALTFTPVPQAGSEVAFDWLRLEPDATGEVVWDMHRAEESAKIEGLADAAATAGGLRGKATGETVSLELVLPDGGLGVRGLPFLSFKTGAAQGLAQVEYWWQQAGAEQRGGTATFALQKDLPAQCVDLSRIGFAGATVAGEENWGGPEGKIVRLRLTLPAEKDKDWALDWVRLGPNWDLRAVPAEEPPG